MNNYHGGGPLLRQLQGAVKRPICVITHPYRPSRCLKCLWNAARPLSHEISRSATLGLFFVQIIVVLNLGHINLQRWSEQVKGIDKTQLKFLWLLIEAKSWPQWIHDPLPSQPRCPATWTASGRFWSWLLGGWRQCKGRWSVATASHFWKAWWDLVDNHQPLQPVIHHQVFIPAYRTGASTRNSSLSERKFYHHATLKLDHLIQVSLVLGANCPL